MPQTIIDKVLGMNERKARLYRENAPLRHEYRRKHPTQIAVTMCMDGRINFSRICGLLFGIVLPFRNVGGIYCVGWPLLNRSLWDWAYYAHTNFCPALLIITYHWSEGDTSRGCAGFNNKKLAAIEFMEGFKREVDEAFPGLINTVLVGIETDSEALTIHGEHGETINMEHLVSAAEDPALLRSMLQGILPSLPDRVQKDIVPLLQGNARHIIERRANPVDLSSLRHKERMLAIGQGFDWMENDNDAIVIGPCNPEISGPIIRATGIIESNVKSGLVDASGGVLFSLTAYRHQMERGAAIRQSLYFAQEADKCIRASYPGMAEFFHPLVAVIDYGSRELEVIKRAA